MSQETTDSENKPFANSYAAMVRRIAVLAPLFGRIHSAEAIADLDGRLWTQWRARIQALDAAGWSKTRERPRSRRFPNGSALTPALGRKMWMLRCPSAFAETNEAKPCNTTGICPHCWARNASSVWQAADTRLFGVDSSKKDLAARNSNRAASQTTPHEPRTGLRPSRRPTQLVKHDMIERVMVFEIPFTDNPRYREAEWLNCCLKNRLNRQARRNASGDLVRRTPDMMPSRRNEHGLFTRLGVIGGLDVTSVDLLLPPKGETGGQDLMPLGWRITVRQILIATRDRTRTIMDDDLVMQGPEILRQLGRTAKVRLVEQPTRMQFARAVARAFRYPAALLHGPVGPILTTLAARENQRMTATFGVLRGATPEGPLATQHLIKERERETCHRKSR